MGLLSAMLVFISTLVLWNSCRDHRVNWVYHTSLLDRYCLCKLAHPLQDHALAAWVGGLEYLNMLWVPPAVASSSNLCQPE